MTDRPLAKIIFPGQNIGGVTASLGCGATENIANAILHWNARARTKMVAA